MQLVRLQWQAIANREFGKEPLINVNHGIFPALQKFPTFLKVAQ